MSDKYRVHLTSGPSVTVLADTMQVMPEMFCFLRHDPKREASAALRVAAPQNGPMMTMVLAVPREQVLYVELVP